MWQFIVTWNRSSSTSSTCLESWRSIIRLPISSSLQSMECLWWFRFARLLNQWHQRTRRWQVSQFHFYCQSHLMENLLTEVSFPIYISKTFSLIIFFLHILNRYPAGVNPAACPNYPYCDTGAHRQYPAGLSAASCPNYPYCA